MPWKNSEQFRLKVFTKVLWCVGGMQASFKQLPRRGTCHKISFHTWTSLVHSSVFPAAEIQCVCIHLTWSESILIERSWKPKDFLIQSLAVIQTGLKYSAGYELKLLMLLAVLPEWWGVMTSPVPTCPVLRSADLNSGLVHARPILCQLTYTPGLYQSFIYISGNL